MLSLPFLAPLVSGVVTADLLLGLAAAAAGGLLGAGARRGRG